MTQLDYYKLLFITELLILAILFSLGLKKREHFALRITLGILFCYLVAFFYPVLDTVSFTGWYSSIMFITLFITVLLFLKFTYKISWSSAFFCSITAYTVQHLAYVLFLLISTATGLTSGSGMYGNTIFDLNNLGWYDLFVALIYVGIYLLVYWGSYLFLKKKLIKDGDIVLKNLSLLVFAALILLVDIVLNAFVVYIPDSNKNYTIIICVYNILCCLLVFYIQISLVNEKQMRKEIELASQLVYMTKQQYFISKENINLINLKCHDLKHQVRQFARKGGIDKDSIEEIDKMISIYDSAVDTGNEELDLILTEKSLLCQKNGIKLTCMADCGKLNFIKESDLYVLFGNAIDNGIEAVMNIDDKDKRYIGLTVHNIGAMITINVNNYCNCALKLDREGLPFTTKKDKDYHGYGLKSIKMIVEKYNGDLSVIIEDNVFNLNLFLPVPRSKS